MQFTENLNLVIPARKNEKGEALLYVYHTPISREIFEANYRIIAATQSALFGKGIVFAAQTAPRIASLRLMDEGYRDSAERGDYDVEGRPKDGGATAFLMEIKRLTTILCPTPSGWTQLPIDAAINGHHIDMDEWKELESLLVFFTCSFVMASRSTRNTIVVGLAGVMKASITSLPPLEYVASLQQQNRAPASLERAAS